MNLHKAKNNPGTFSNRPGERAIHYDWNKQEFFK